MDVTLQAEGESPPLLFCVFKNSFFSVQTGSRPSVIVVELDNASTVLIHCGYTP
jgi:hypothetical protein